MPPAAGSHGVGPRERSVVRALVALSQPPVEAAALPRYPHRVVQWLRPLAGEADIFLLLAEGPDRLELVSYDPSPTDRSDVVPPVPPVAPGTEAVRSGRSVVDVEVGFPTGPVVTAVPLLSTGGVVGAICMARSAGGRSSPEDVRAVERLADFVGQQVFELRQLDREMEVSRQLEGALRTRIVIEQAKGMVHARTGAGMEGALQALLRYGSGHELGVAEVARRVLAGTVGVDQLSRP